MSVLSTIGTATGGLAGMYGGGALAAYGLGEAGERMIMPLIYGGMAAGGLAGNAIAPSPQPEQTNASQAQKILEDYYLKQRQGIVR